LQLQVPTNKAAWTSEQLQKKHAIGSRASPTDKKASPTDKKERPAVNALRTTTVRGSDKKQSFTHRRIRRTSTAMFVMAIVGMVLGVPLASEASASSGKAPIKVGIMVGLSSPFGAIAKSTLVGANYAIKLQNKAGGIDGHKIVSYVVDDAGTAPGSTSAYLQLTTVDHVSLVTGVDTTFELAPAASVAESHKDYVPMFNVSGTVIGANPGSVSYNWEYGDYINLNDEAPEQLQNLVDYFHVKNVGVLYTNDSQGDTNYANAQKAAAKLGATIVAAEPVDINATSLLAPLTALKSAGVQGFLDYLDGTPALSLGLYEARSTLNWYVPAEMQDTNLDASGLKVSNPLTKGSLYLTICAATTPAYQKFAAATASQLTFTGSDSQFAAAQYEGLEVAFHAMSSISDPTNETALNKAIQNDTKNFPSICGTGHVTLSPLQHYFNPVTPIYEYSNGKIKYVVK
jgi:ABC-type branched-subunit amino acid transport system substrate-binding protein